VLIRLVAAITICLFVAAVFAFGSSFSRTQAQRPAPKMKINVRELLRAMAAGATILIAFRILVALFQRA
jgi:hypothetical protein